MQHSSHGFADRVRFVVLAMDWILLMWFWELPG